MTQFCSRESTHPPLFVTAPRHLRLWRRGGPVKAAKRRREALTGPSTATQAGSRGGVAPGKRRQRVTFGEQTGSFLDSAEGLVIRGAAYRERAWAARSRRHHRPGGLGAAVASSRLAPVAQELVRVLGAVYSPRQFLLYSCPQRSRESAFGQPTGPPGAAGGAIVPRIHPTIDSGATALVAAPGGYNSPVKDPCRYADPPRSPSQRGHRSRPSPPALVPGRSGPVEHEKRSR